MTVVYHRTKDKMPAGAEESQGAMDEGVQFLFELAPMRVLGTSHVEGLEVRKVVPGPLAPSADAPPSPRFPARNGRSRAIRSSLEWANGPT